MKKKMLGGVSLLLLFTGCVITLLHSLVKSPTTLTPNAATASAPQVIIAPAIIDHPNDVTRVPTLQSGVVNQVAVKAGQQVVKGQLLLTLDNTQAINNVAINRESLSLAKKVLFVKKEALKHSKQLFDNVKNLDKRLVSQIELQEKSHQIRQYAAEVSQARHNLTITRNNLKNSELALSQYTITAPKDGVILQINAHIDEYVGGGQAIVLLGDAQKVIVRVSIDERDLKDFHSTAPASLTINEDTHTEIPLVFMQRDQYINLHEHLNARVQEVLYYFNRKEYSQLIAGQQFDAHIVVKKVS